MFSDSLGNVFVAYIYKNRFVTVAMNSRAYALQFLDMNKLVFAVATYDRNVKIVNNAGTLLEVLKGHKKKVTAIKVNYSRQVFLTMSKESINLWNLKTFRRIRTLFPKKEPFSQAVFSPDADYLISRFEVGSLEQSGKVYYWNLTTFEMEKEFDVDPVYSLFTVLSDGKNFVAG